MLPDNLLLAGIFGRRLLQLDRNKPGTIVALTPVAVGLAERRASTCLHGFRHRGGGSFFGDNLSFISDTTIASTKTRDCVMRTSSASTL